jgi:hypothetical protein
MKSAHRISLSASSTRLGSDEMLGDIKRDAESGNAEGNRQSGMQEVAEIFVELEECHGVAPSCWFAIAGERPIGSDQVRCDAHRDADKRNDEGQGESGVEEVAEIFVIENSHWVQSFRWFAMIGGRSIDRIFAVRVA